VKATITTYWAFLEELRMGRELDLRDSDYDTGAATKLGEYGLADKAYSKLLRQLAEGSLCLRNSGTAREHFVLLLRLIRFQLEDKRQECLGSHLRSPGTTAGKTSVSRSCGVV
jgi:hypothetical protein